VIYRFDGFELDTDVRELRAGGHVRALQPQALAVLEYLIRHRQRAVSKQELLEALWPDAVVGEGSVQRAVSLARAALDDDGARIRTIARHGYRFVAEVEEAAEPAPVGGFLPRFARSGDVHIAFHTIGEGPIDMVVVPGWVFPMRAFLDHPGPRRSIERLAELGRVILFDKRGTGLSDRVKTLPTLEQRIDDLRAVLEEAGSSEALLIGYSEGGPLCLLYATTYPERTRGLLLCGSFARWAAGAGYEHGLSAAVVSELREYIATSWGTGRTIQAIVASRAEHPDVAAWAARAEQEGASPGAAKELLEMNLAIDVRPLLPAVAVPTVVMHQRDDAVISIDNARYLAEHIPGATLVELPGRDHLLAFEGVEELRAQAAWLLGRARAHEDHFLATILVAAGALADRDEGRDAALEEVVGRHRGVSAGDGRWSFDGPQRAIRCAHALIPLLSAAGAPAAIGVHTGEVTRSGGALRGDALCDATAIARAAEAGEVWVSRVVRDLVHGARLDFEERGEVSTDDGRNLAVLRSVPAPAPVGAR
jgi:pimeloyl-ACP methyl ester carboxylesterase/DNA-binding winged helix-turn-helix (wHTH) protein